MRRPSAGLHYRRQRLSVRLTALGANSRGTSLRTSHATRGLVLSTSLALGSQARTRAMITRWSAYWATWRASPPLASSLADHLGPHFLPRSPFPVLSTPSGVPHTGIPTACIYLVWHWCWFRSYAFAAALHQQYFRCCRRPPTTCQRAAGRRTPRSVLRYKRTARRAAPPAKQAAAHTSFLLSR